VYGCAVDAAEVELNRAFRDVVSSGEASRYGASKRTDLLRVVGVVFAAVKVEDRVLSLGVVVDVVGVWPWNCADSSWYCLRSFGSWVERSESLLPHLSVHSLLLSCLDPISSSSSSFTLSSAVLMGRWERGTHPPKPPSSSSACVLNVSSPARKDSKERVMFPSVLVLAGKLREAAR
jgi:hypothetical protein